MNLQIRPEDPSDLGYPATFPIELALKVDTPRRICEGYGIDEERWRVLRCDPGFQRDLASAVEMVKKEGVSFKLKAQLQSEELLKTSYRMARDIDTPASVRADLIKFTIKCAGYADTEAIQQQKGSGFSITINLPHPGQQPKVLEHVVAEQ